MSRNFQSCRLSVSAATYAVVGTVLLGLIAVSLNGNSASAAPISFTGSTYGQDFDSLASSSLGATPAWNDGVTLPGWYGFVEGAVSTNYRVNNGNFFSPRLLSSLGSIGGSGTNPDSDRALGTQSTPSSNERFGVAFTNASVGTMIEFTATYDGEQWRRINNEGADDLIVDFQIFDAGLGSLTAGGTWTTLPGLTFNAPNISVAASSTSIDGNALSNRVAGLTQTVSDLEWNPGQELWLRFTDSGPAQHMLAADNFTFSAVVQPIPEPSSLLLLSLGALGMIRKLRRRDVKS